MVIGIKGIPIMMNHTGRLCLGDRDGIRQLRRLSRCFEDVAISLSPWMFQVCHVLHPSVGEFVRQYHVIERDYIRGLTQLAERVWEASGKLECK